MFLSKRLFLVLLFAAMLLPQGCSKRTNITTLPDLRLHVPHPQSTSEQRFANFKIDIIEMVFRHLFVLGGFDSRDIDYYCLKIANSDPTSDFLSRFRKNRPVVKPGSMFRNPLDFDLNKDTGPKLDGRCVLFALKHLKFTSPNTISVKCSIYAGPDNAGYYTLTIKRYGLKWHISDRKIDRLS